MDEEKAQLPMAPTPSTLPSHSQPIPMVLLKVTNNHMDEEEKTWALFTDGFLQYAGTTRMWYSTTLFLGDP